MLPWPSWPCDASALFLSLATFLLLGYTWPFPHYDNDNGFGFSTLGLSALSFQSLTCSVILFKPLPTGNCADGQVPDQGQVLGQGLPLFTAPIQLL